MPDAHPADERAPDLSALGALARDEKRRITEALARGEQLVYFIQAEAGGPIKIGVAHRPDERLRDLQVGAPSVLVIRKVFPGGVPTERQLHERFSAQRLSGEWFRPSDELCRLANGRRIELPAVEDARDEGFKLGYAAARREIAERPGALTARAVGKLLDVSSETVLRWTRRGDLPAVRLPGGALRYLQEDITTWIEEHRS